ncbi:hypothetical protein [Formosa sp. L2A11]|uniref:hypothetical protein n=1 Tax=Formosa sp. L2A11 TaxID=2686363 RepID=UPI00131C09AC|nr:hypothetical protein [Formosa sp. L2A11]
MKSVLLILVLFGASGSIYAHTETSLVLLDTINTSNNYVNYQVYDNQESITFNMRTSEPRAIMSILHHGVTIFFDIKGTEKKKVYVTYPEEPLKITETPEFEVSNNFQSEADIKKIRHTIKERISQDFPEDALFVSNHDKESFNVFLNSIDIKAIYSYNENNGELNYRLTIPKDKINNKNNFSKLKIGVYTIKKERSNIDEQAANFGSGMSGPDSNQAGLSDTRNDRGGSRNGQSQNNPRPDELDSNEGPIEISFWFKAHM